MSDPTGFHACYGPDAERRKAFNAAMAPNALMQDGRISEGSGKRDAGYSAARISDGRRHAVRAPSMAEAVQDLELWAREVGGKCDGSASPALEHLPSMIEARIAMEDIRKALIALEKATLAAQPHADFLVRMAGDDVSLPSWVCGLNLAVNGKCKNSLFALHLVVRRWMKSP